MSYNPVLQRVDGALVSAIDEASLKDCSSVLSTLESLPSYANYTTTNPNGTWKANKLEREGHYGAIPQHYRLTYTFLKQIGRQLDEKNVQQLEVGVPNIVLPEDRTNLLTDTTITLSGKKIDDVAREFAFDGSPVQGGLGTKMYGTRSFTISGKEIIDLTQTLRYVTDKTLPKSFYASLLWSFSEGDWIRYCSIFRTVAIGDLGNAEGSAVIDARRALANRLKELTEKLSRPYANRDEEDEDKQDLEKYQTNYNYLNSEKRKEMDMRRRTLNENLRRSVPLSQDKCGFSSLTFNESFEKTMALSLTELSSHITHSIKGYLFVDGRGENWNQLCERTPQPITFVSATGIDFCTPTTTVLEGKKYFCDRGDDCVISERFKGWLPEGQKDLYERIKGLYRLIYRAFQIQRTKNPVLLALGLGVFLQNVDNDIRDSVVEMYFRAQFDLLCENNYGFQCVWLNAARYTKVAQDLVQSGRFKFKCNFVVHGKDCKFLVVELAKMKRCAGYLNPSDVIAVMQGLVGYYWEIGRQDRYVGEEDLTATSTIILQHHNIAPETELESVVDDEDMPGTPDQWCPVKEPHDYSYFEKTYPTV